MKRTLTAALGVGIILHPCAFPCAQGPLAPPGAPAATMMTLDQIEPRRIVNAANTPGDSLYLTGEKAIERFKNTGQYESLSAAITGARYGVRTSPGREPAATAANPAHGLSSMFTPDGLRLRVRVADAAGAPAPTVTWRLESLGYGAAQWPVPAGALKTEGARVELARASPCLTEWFQNTPAGLEHGFTLAERPSANPEGEPLRLVIAVVGDLTPHAGATGQSLSLCDATGRAVVSYSKLKVWDATGTELSATMQTGVGHVILSMNEATAQYPLTIDPTFMQQAYLKASNTEANDLFGISVAVSGDTVVVGARYEDGGATGVNGDQSDNSALISGAAYVFVRSGTTWTQQAYLKASNTESEDDFGYSVTVSGDTVVVGAPGEDSNATEVNGNQSDNSAPYSGAAYVFVRSGTTWTQQAYLKASNTGQSDTFGASVAVSEDTVVVGAPGEDSNATGVNGNQSDNSALISGAAYVFVRSGTTWTQQAYLKASNTGQSDTFGSSVAVSGDAVVVGAPNEDSNATGVNGNQSDNSASASGAAYVFVRSGTTWSQDSYLKASNTGATDEFGASVAVSGDTVVVGAPGEDSNATGVNGNQNDNSASSSGAAYVFVRNPLTLEWRTAYLKASNTESGDQFGFSVAVSGGTVVIGALAEDSNAVGVNGNQSDNSASASGAAYVFVRGGTVFLLTWTQQAYLKASNTEANDQFGSSVAVSGSTVVVGAYLEASSATGVNGNQSDNCAATSGAAYMFDLTAPEIAVEQPAGADIADGGSQDFVIISGSTNLTFTINNTGTENLTGLTITKDGADAALFTITANPTAPVAPGSNTTFTVQFAPTSGGAKIAALHIANNDANENPFDLNLNGYTLTSTQDTDGDGLNDAAEFLLAALGFDWKTNQASLVSTYFANANVAGLFTESQIQALHIDTPLLSRNPATGAFKLTLGLQKSTDLTQFAPFPFTNLGTTINGQGQLEFEFMVPDNAAFFLIEAR